MEFRFIEGVGKSDSNTIYIEPENEISRDNLILKLIAIGKIERHNKIRLNLDRIYNKKLKQFIIDFITIQTYNYKKRDLIKNIRMPGKSTIGSVITPTEKKNETNKNALYKPYKEKTLLYHN